MKTKMTKKPLKKAQTGTTVGAEQGKGAKLLRTAGIATPIIGAIGMGIKALKDRKKKKQEAYISAKKDKKKTGGMVNPNAKASASTTATGYSGGISSAPKTALPKAQYGRAISEKAANRKVSKGKGTIAKPYPSGPDEKGSYVGFSKEARRSDSPFVSMKNSKAPRPIQKKGGAVKKQMGGNAGSYTPPNQPGGKPTAGGYTAPKGTGLNSAPGKRQIKRDFKKMIRNQSKNG